MSVLLGDRYEILAPIGAGTAANVFRVRDSRDGVVRAAKVLKPENAQVPAILARFENEYRILRTLHHPHLPEVYDYGWTDDGGRFLVMELVDGEPLDAYFRARPRDLWVILYQLCEVLNFIHNHALLHQDVKPSNILVKRTTAFGDEIPLVKLIDFGLTYRRDTGERVQMVGTPEYMAPEVARGEAPLTRAVDYYSAGVVLYELLCGHVPFRGTVTEVLRAHLESTPVIEDEELEWAEVYPHVRGLLNKDRRARLEAFEELRRGVVTRLTGGLPTLDRAYGAARIESLGMIGKRTAWHEFIDATLPVDDEHRLTRVSVSGQPLSGRSHLLESARSEWRIRGIPAWQLGDDSDAAWLMNRPGDSPAPATEKDFERAWARVEAAASKSRVWIIASGELTPEEGRLYGYFETGWTLAGPEVRRNVGFVTATAAEQAREPLESDEGMRVIIPPLTLDDARTVVERFRGEILRSADAQLILDVLKEVRESGEIMRLLRRLIAEGGIVFEAQRWRVVRERALSIAREPASPGGHFVLPLSPVQKRVMVCLACHPGPVPVGWLPGIAELDDGAVAGALHDLRLRHLLEPVDLGGTAAVRTTSGTVERAVLREADPKELRGIHRAYAARLAIGAGVSTDDRRTLALHEERSGDERSAYLTRRGLFKELWKRRAHGEIEQICRDAMAAESLRFGLARAYLRELVNVLWAQNLTARAYHDMKAFGERYGEVPRGLLPKYARGLSDALGPKKGLVFVKSVLKKARRVSGGLLTRLQVEHALILYNVSRHGAGRRVAATAKNAVHLLSQRERCRLAIYSAMLQPGVSTRVAGQHLRSAQRTAETHNLTDELAMIQALRAISEVDSGRPAEALRVISKAMRHAARERLVLRQYQLYAQAASAYSELGDHGRAIKCRERTVWMAQYLGQGGLLASSWWRVAYYSGHYGACGNAIRYYQQALPLLRSASRASDFIMARILQHDLYVFIGSPRVRSLAAGARAALTQTSDVGEQGSLAMVGADQMLQSGRWREARRVYREARSKCLRAGRKDDSMRAAVGEARALMLLGRLAECRKRLVSSREKYSGFGNVDGVAKQCLADLLYRFRVRDVGRVSHLLRRCENLVSRTTVSTRLELLEALFRAYARMGKIEDARRLLISYEGTVWRVTSSFEDDELALRFLKRIGYSDASREAVVLERRSAHIGSGDVGTASPIDRVNVTSRSNHRSGRS